MQFSNNPTTVYIIFVHGGTIPHRHIVIKIIWYMVRVCFIVKQCTTSNQANEDILRGGRLQIFTSCHNAIVLICEGFRVKCLYVKYKYSLYYILFALLISSCNLHYFTLKLQDGNPVGPCDFYKQRKNNDNSKWLWILLVFSSLIKTWKGLVHFVNCKLLTIFNKQESVVLNKTLS